MNSNANPIWTLLWTFGLMSLFAVGGANSAIPEMHRVAVDVRHWMDDKQFADLFAISQLSPGPNVLIVTLIVMRLPVSRGRWWRHWQCAGRPQCLPTM
jgi:chromate transporter